MFKEILPCGLDKGPFLLMGRCHPPQSGLSDLDSSELGRQSIALHSPFLIVMVRKFLPFSVKLAHSSPGASRDCTLAQPVGKPYCFMGVIRKQVFLSSPMVPSLNLSWWLFHEPSSWHQRLPGSQHRLHAHIFTDLWLCFPH